MMASRSAHRIETALSSKGFILSRGKHDHRWWVFHVEGKPTKIKTRISHSFSEYGDKGLGWIQEQLHISKRQLLDLVDCGLTEGMYLALLREQGLLR